MALDNDTETSVASARTGGSSNGTDPEGRDADPVVETPMTDGQTGHDGPAASSRRRDRAREPTAAAAQPTIAPDDDFVFDFDGPPDPDQPPPAPPVPEMPPGPLAVPAPPMAPPPGPMAARRRAKLQARKVRRIVRHVEPWSVLKISLIFYFCLWLIFLLAGVLLWSVAVSSGIVGKVENFIIELFALEEFEFNAGEIFRGYALGGLVMVFASTAFNVLLCVLFNLISDLTGGLRVTVVEEETARFMPRRAKVRAAGRRR